MKFLKFKFLFIVLITLLSFSYQSCSPTKYLPEGKYIVNNVKIESDNKDIKTSKLKNVVQPQPLKKLFGFYSFRARIYNIPNPKKDGIRNNKKNIRLKKINAKREKRFNKKTEKIQKERNTYFNKSNRLLASGDTIGYIKAKNTENELDKKLNYRKLHTPELKEENLKTDVFTLYGFLRRLGQKPELYDTMLVNYTLRQMKVFLKNQGYFKSNVSFDADTLGKKVNITYKIESGAPLKITSATYSFPDSTPEMRAFFDKLDYKFKAGSNFDVGELEKYRTKLSEQYRNNGFYYFSKQLISYKIDTIDRYNTATLLVNFNNTISKKVYQPWIVKNIYIHNDYNPNFALQNPEEYYKKVRSVPKNKYNILTRNETVIKSDLLFNEIYVYPDSAYSLKNTKTSYSHLSKFKIYKLINIQYRENPDSTNNFLDCDILLTPDKKKTVIYNLESTNTSASIGGAGNALFSHKNLFHGGEVLDIKLQLALEKQKTQDTTDNLISINTQEYSLDMKLTIPRLLIPIKNSFIKQNNPKTVVSSLFSYQNRPEFNKTQVVLNFDLYLKSSDFVNHILTPVRISFVRVPSMSPDFEAWLKNVMLKESYEDHFIIGSKYSYTFSNQGTKGNNIFLQANFSAAGNALYGAMKTLNIDTVGSSYVLPIVKTPFAQFVKADFDFRFYSEKIDEKQIVLRLFTGVAVPYGNSNLLPFGEKYFVGGANSIRAWQARSLGPGEYVQPPDSESKFSNQTGDIKLEFNAEYRFTIINFLEGAFFVDAGNIWAINSYDSRIGGIFFINKFYKQIAVGTGFGTRLNLNFFILRTDIGIKVIDPAASVGNRFIPMSNRNYSLKDDFTINIAFGYPF